MPEDNRGALYVRCAIPGLDGQPVGQIFLNFDVALKMWQRHHAMHWYGCPEAEEGLPTAADVEQNLVAAATWIAERAAQDIPVSLASVKDSPVLAEETPADAEQALDQLDEHIHLRDLVGKNVAICQLRLCLELPVDSVLGSKRSRLQLAEDGDLTFGEYLALAVEMGEMNALRDAFRWFRRLARSAPKSQDWPTILGNTHKPIAPSNSSCQRSRRPPIGKPMLATRSAAGLRQDLKNMMLRRQRRAPAAIAAEIVARECRDQRMRVQATTVQKMWKRRRSILANEDRDIAQ